MARLTRRLADTTNVRVHLIERMARSLLRTPDRERPGGGMFVNPAGRQLERLRRGDPVTVHWFELPTELAALWSHRRVRVDADGSLAVEGSDDHG